MDDFSCGHLLLLKYQASFPATHEYDHSLLFHVMTSYHLECSKITGSLQTQGLPALTVYCHLFLYYFKMLFYTISLIFLSFLPPHRCMLETLFSLSWIPQKQHVIAQRLKAGMRMNAGATALRSYWLQWESQQDRKVLVRLNNPTE